MSDLIERLGIWSKFGYGVDASATMTEAAAAITQLQAELAEAREAPGRIAAWLVSIDGPELDPEMPIAGSQFGILMQAADAIETRDWSKP